MRLLKMLILLASLSMALSSCIVAGPGYYRRPYRRPVGFYAVPRYHAVPHYHYHRGGGHYRRGF